MSNDLKDSPRFLDAVDTDLRKNIIQLDQKLKGVRTEIEVKLKTLQKTETKEKQEKRANLELLSQEIDLALECISKLVELAIDYTTPGEFRKNNLAALERLNGLFSSNIEEIVAIREKI